MDTQPQAEFPLIDEVNWLLDNLVKADGSSDCNIPVTFGGETKQINLAQFAEVRGAMFVCGSRHYGTKDVLHGIAYPFFDKLDQPTGTYGQDGTWPKLVKVTLVVRDGRAKMVTLWRMMDSDGKPHPDHKDLVELDQVSKGVLTKLQRLRAFSCVRAYLTGATNNLGGLRDYEWSVDEEAQVTTFKHLDEPATQDQ